jgi:type I restriction enzyme S subunit
MVSFNCAVKDRTGGQYKVLKRDYLPHGQIPVIDQGQKFIAGYTNNHEAIYKGELPVVLFGDHTLAFKYVDFPFALGADGVKVLSIDRAFVPKFIFYYWISIPIQSRGYSRHFKYLREIELPLIPLSEQHRIVEILDQADALCKKRVKADAKAASILLALFYKMFGDPAMNPRGWDEMPLSKACDDIYRYPSYYGIEYVERGIPEIRGELIQSDGTLNTHPEQLRYIAKETSDRFPRKRSGNPIFRVNQ